MPNVGSYCALSLFSEVSQHLKNKKIASAYTVLALFLLTHLCMMIQKIKFSYIWWEGWMNYLKSSKAQYIPCNKCLIYNFKSSCDRPACQYFTNASSAAKENLSLLDPCLSRTRTHKHTVPVPMAKAPPLRLHVLVSTLSQQAVILLRYMDPRKKLLTFKNFQFLWILTQMLKPDIINVWKIHLGTR